MALKFSDIQPNNPTDEERYRMVKDSLKEVNRIEDFNNIIELLGPPPEITKLTKRKNFKDIKVGIIGAGTAGLSSAFELRKLGFNITIFDIEKNRIGGRVYTHYFDKNKKYYGELGAMRIPVSHETVWHYINLFGLDTNPFIQTNTNALIYVRNKRVRNDLKGKNVMKEIYPEFNMKPWEKETPWTELIDYALGNEIMKLTPEMRREILEIKEQYSEEINALGKLSIRKVMEKMNLSEGAIEVISCVNLFLGYFYYTSFFENLQEQYSVDYQYRYELVGGMAKLPLAFYNSLKSKEPKEYKNIKNEELGNIKFKLGKMVTKIGKDKENKINIEYIEEKTSKIFSETFDYVICAIPFSSLRNVEIYPMFSTEKMQAIKEMNYYTAQKTFFMCNERFWEKGNIDEKIIGGSSSTDLIIGSTWYPSHNSAKKGVLLASYNINLDAVRIGNLDKKIRMNKVKREVEEVHGLEGGYLDSIVEDYKMINWENEKGFYGAFSYYMPEQQRLFAYASAKPEYDNRVFFAGEHVSLTHAWTQGALNSGMKAANSLVIECDKNNK